MAIKKNLMKTPIKPDPMGLEELRFNLGLSDLIGKENPQFQVEAIRSHRQGIKQMMAPCRFFFQF